MIDVQRNESVRNVAENSLSGLTLLRDSVFFGINGSGKTTVTEVLSQSATLVHRGSAGGVPVRVVAFDDNWRKSRVGEFVEGGSAEGVTTVKLGEDAGQLEEEIHKAEKELESATSTVALKQSAADNAVSTQKMVIDEVFHGSRKLLESKCASLNGTKFRRPAIRALLERGNNEILPQSELENQLLIANSESPGTITSLPELPQEWHFPDPLWEEMTEKVLNSEAVDDSINEWIREGLLLHKPGDSCQFCTGTVKESRISTLFAIIERVEKLASSLAISELENCRNALTALQKFGDALKSCDFSTTIYGDDLGQKAEAVSRELPQVIDGLMKSEKLLENYVRNPQSSVTNEMPKIECSALRSSFDSLNRAHSEVIGLISRHAQNQSQAIEQLKSHCCAMDGGGWSAATKFVEIARNELTAALEAENLAKDVLNSLKVQVSTTADTAKFLDANLSLILGDSTLRVEEGQAGEGYRITRYQQKAEGMSEGEKKLISLLYFCAEFLAEDRKQSLENTVIIFDDLGSELDEPRLLMIDRFISNHFQKPKPAALVYFTHSHTYLKILQSRLGNGAVASESRAGAKVATSIFYEVYKDNFSPGKQTTKCRKWDDEAVQLTNDYWLSFYMVLRAFEDLQSGDSPALGTGNFCRKVLEGFTEFRAPSAEKFGVRMNEILTKRKLKLSPALSKIVNGLSHLDLTSTGGVLSRNEVEQAIIQTLNFMRLVDSEHLDALLIKFRGKKKRREILHAIEQRTGN